MGKVQVQSFSSTKPAPSGDSTTKRSQDTLQMQNTNRVVTGAYAQHAVDLSASLPLTFRTGRGMSVIASWPMPGPGKGHLVLKKLKTRLRSTLKNDMLEALMHVAINGLDVSQSQCLWLHLPI